MGEDGCDGDGHIVVVASLRTALARFTEESTEKLSEEDQRQAQEKIARFLSLGHVGFGGKIIIRIPSTKCAQLYII